MFIIYFILFFNSQGEPVELNSKFMRYSTFRSGKEQLVRKRIWVELLFIYYCHCPKIISTCMIVIIINTCYYCNGEITIKMP